MAVSSTVSFQGMSHNGVSTFLKVFYQIMRTGADLPQGSTSAVDLDEVTLDVPFSPGDTINQMSNAIGSACRAYALTRGVTIAVNQISGCALAKF